MFVVMVKIKELFKIGSAEKKRFSHRESMCGVPVLSEGVSTEDGPNGQMLLLIPRKLKVFKCLQKYMSEDLPPAKIILDDLGAKVVNLINGTRNVAKIAEKFAEETLLHSRESEASVVEFLNMLMGRGVIMIVVEKDKKLENV